MDIERRAFLGMTVRGAVFLGIGAIACSGDEVEDKADEAIEELRDEAKDAKEEIEDEIDDHT